MEKYKASRLNLQNTKSDAIEMEGGIVFQKGPHVLKRELGIYIGRVPITTTNMSDVLGNGQVKLVKQVKSNKYELILTNFHLTVPAKTVDTYGILISDSFKYPLDIVLVGENSIIISEHAGKESVYGIGSQSADLNITTREGEQGSIKIESGDTNTYSLDDKKGISAGIYSASNINISGEAKVFAHGGKGRYSYGLLVRSEDNNKITISEKAHVIASSTETRFYLALEEGQRYLDYIEKNELETLDKDIQLALNENIKNFAIRKPIIYKNNNRAYSFSKAPYLRGDFTITIDDNTLYDLSNIYKLDKVEVQGR